MEITCDCGNSFIKERKTHKYCSWSCKQRAGGRVGGKAGKGVSRNVGAIRSDLTLRNLTNNPAKRQEENPNWKGNNVGYIAIHNWAYRYVGLKDACEKCGSTRILEMSNKSQQYKREIEDWWTLCKLCHAKFDAEFRRNGGVTRKLHRWKQKTSQ